MKAPKSLTNHKAVDRVESGEAAGSDYKFFVYLKRGYTFTEGKCEGTGATCAGVQSYKYFMHLAPKKVP